VVQEEGRGVREGGAVPFSSGSRALCKCPTCYLQPFSFWLARTPQGPSLPVDPADLSHADLSRADEVTDDQLAEAGSLEGATMPNGQKYEDWLKSKDQEENKKSHGSS
jgi:hypothetical protein